MKRILENWLPLGLITLVTLLTYGILIQHLGFYRDDWYLFATAQSQGPAGVVALFQIDRPLVGYFYALGYELLGGTPLPWHLAALMIRLIANLTFFWLLNLLWPQRKKESLAVALLFSVYPGFSEQPNAGVYISDLTANALALISLVITIKAAQSSRAWLKVIFYILVGLLILLYLGMFESAIGLEVVRFGLLWYVISAQGYSDFKSSMLRTLKASVPYLFCGAAFLIWRLFFFQSTRRSTNLGVLFGKYSGLPLHSIISITVETLKDILEITIFAWVVPFYQFVAQSNYSDLAIAVGLGALVAVCIFFVLQQIRHNDASLSDDWHADQHAHLIWLGLFFVVFALLPINIAGRNVYFSNQWDRYTLYASAGVAMVIGGSIFYFFQGSFQKTLLLTLLGMSVIFHYFNGIWYRDFWTQDRNIWQQMVWRAPSLKPGTMLFASPAFVSYLEGYEIYSPANMVYYPGEGIQIGGEVLNSDTAANIQLQKNKEHHDRSLLIEDNYKNILIIVQPSKQSCLHVLDGRMIELPGLVDNSLVADVASYSRIDQIETSATAPTLPSFFGRGEVNPWCFYYQKMSLARQQGNWQEIARLADEAQNKGLTPDDFSEWMPALDAYATLDRVKDARHAASIIRSSDKARAFLCLQLQRGAVYLPPYKYNEVNQLLCEAD